MILIRNEEVRKELAMKTGEAWEKELGIPFGIIIAFYSAAKKLWAKMKIGPEILHWMLNSTEGKFCFQEAVAAAGKNYLDTKNQNANRFKMLSQVIDEGKFVEVKVDLGLPKTVIEKDKRFFKILKNDCKGKVVVRRVGNEVYVNNERLVITRPKSTAESVYDVVKKGVAPSAAVPAVILDCLLEHPELIPEVETDFCKKDSLIFFTKNPYGNTESTTSGFRTLFYDKELKETEYLIGDTTVWQHQFCIAMLVPESKMF